MKVGILTYHNAYNYGAVLQCYALQEYIKSMGHEVEVIDYRNEWVEGIYKPLSYEIIRRFSRHPKALVGYLRSIGNRWHQWITKKNKYKSFVNNYLILSTLVKDDIPNSYDVIIIGSDQMWGLSCLGGVFDNVYLGKLSGNSARVVGYAISTDGMSLRKLYSEGEFESVMKRFHMISFREDLYTSFVRQYTDKNVCTCVDPTLLLPPSGWNNLLTPKWLQRKYVAIYQVRRKNKYEDYIYNQAVKCAKRIGLDCEIIDLNSNYSVEDFVSIIKNAQLVITSSFHATVFSVIFETKFYSVVLNDGHDARYVNMLGNIGLQSRLIEVGTEIQDYDRPLPKYSIHDMIKPSVDFLNKALL